MSEITVSTFYYFTPLEQPSQHKLPLLTRMRELGVRGTITLAGEGINATISGAREAIDTMLSEIRSRMDFNPPFYRETFTQAQPFKRSKVKVKHELISIGAAADPRVCVGQHVRPEDWNALITQPDVITIDTRNQYEFEMGYFKGAVNPATRNFKQMVAWTEQFLAPPLRGSGMSPSTSVGGNSPHIVSPEALPPTETQERFDSPSRGELKRVAMYCTGGIRCEKYSSYLIAQGFTQVYHLAGGILAYLEQIPKSESLWEGECFVFDERETVGHRQ